MPPIKFNGKTYNNIEEMPANERRAFERISQIFVDKNGNGIPDFLEGDVAMKVINASSGSFSIQNQTYNSVNEMPPELQEKVRSSVRLMSKLGMLSKSASEELERSGMLDQGQPAVSKSFPASAIEEERRTSTFTLVMGGIVLCFALAVAAFAVVYLMNR